MATQQILGQIGFFDYTFLKKQVSPQFCNGQLVFVRSLDVVLNATIGRSWLCGEKSENPYYGYSIDFDGGSHTVVWDYDIGDTVFTNEQKAHEKALQIGSSLTKINSESLQLIDLKSFAYVRKLDNYRLTAIIAKVGDNQLYEHEFMCYHFLREYTSTEKRDKEYYSLLSKMSKEAEQSEACELNPPSLETLYKVEKSLYASREFAENKLKKRY